MPTAAELQIVITAQDQASARLRELGQDVQRIERQVESAGGAFGRLGGAIGGLGQIGLAAGGIGAVVSGFQSAFDAVGGVVQQASDLNEQISRSDQVFGDAAQSVQRFAQTTALSLGVSQREALEAAGNFGQLLRTSGLAEDAAGDMSTSLVRLASDLASFNNISTGDALEKLRSGLTGEAEPLRSLGVLLSEDAVKARAMQLGLARTTGELTEAAKVQARYSLIMDQTQRAQGDFQRTGGGLANMLRVIRAAWADIQATLGQAVLPTVVRVVQAFVQQLPRITEAVRTLSAQVAPILERLFSGDLEGGLGEALARLGQVVEQLKPILATWSEAFWNWVREMTPPLLQRLGELAGQLFAWISEQAPPLLERFIGEWVPAFVDWVVKVLPPLLVELGKVVAALAEWATTTGRPELEKLGTALGDAVVAGFVKAIEHLRPLLVRALFQGPSFVDALEAELQRRQAARQAIALPTLGPEVARGAGGGGNTVVVEDGAVRIDGVADPAESNRLRDFLKAALEAYSMGLAASAASTDPGVSTRLQGAGR